MLDPMANGKRDGKGDQRSKRPYEKPELTVIEFTADEVMAVGCKSGPSTNRKPAPGCHLGNCRARGS
jgi:hypothetical protein